MCGCGEPSMTAMPVFKNTSVNCDITRDEIVDWRNALLYAKGENKIALTGLSVMEHNVWLGRMFAAMFYEGDHCELYEGLIGFRELYPNIKTALGI